MSLYNNSFPPSACTRGMDVIIVNAEQLGTGNYSQRAAIADDAHRGPGPVTLTFSYASTPGSVEYDIYVGWDDSLGTAGYTKVGSTTNTSGDQVTIQRSAGNNFRLVLVKEVTSPGVNATCQVRQ